MSPEQLRAAAAEVRSVKVAATRPQTEV